MLLEDADGTPDFRHKYCCLQSWMGTAVERKSNMNACNGRTILYVEDDPVVQVAYGNRLRQEGFRIEPAQDGLEAMKLLLALTPDLVLLDLLLPKFTGEDVLKFIHSQPRLKSVPVIILSTNSIVDATQEPLLEQADRRLIKSICTFPMMLQAIHEALNGTPEKKQVFTISHPEGKLIKLQTVIA
jgi:CheY-like chemotaxis protein